jgi:hypothetical protein
MSSDVGQFVTIVDELPERIQDREQAEIFAR